MHALFSPIVYYWGELVQSLPFQSGATGLRVYQVSSVVVPMQGDFPTSKARVHWIRGRDDKATALQTSFDLFLSLLPDHHTFPSHIVDVLSVVVLDDGTDFRNLHRFFYD